jgi:hypothetical protein
MTTYAASPTEQVAVAADRLGFRSVSLSETAAARGSTDTPPT